MDSPQPQPPQPPQQQPQPPPQQQLLGPAEPQRLLKAKVQVVGRFLLRPEEDFGPEKADELVRRAAKDGTKVRTSLHLYSSGVRLGETGIFASMPLEFIKYQRIAACISPRQQQQPKKQQQQQQSRLLTLCTRDYEQKCVTLLRFKDAAALAEASRLIDRQRRLVAEEADYLMMDKPQPSSHASNWALETAPQQQRQLHQRPDSLSSSMVGFGPFEAASRQQQRRQQQQPVEARVSVRRAGTASTMDDVFYDVADTAAADVAVSPRRRLAVAANGDGGGGRRIDSVIVDYSDVSKNGIGGGGTAAGFVVSAHSSGSSRQHQQQQLHQMQQLRVSASLRGRGDYADGGRSQQHVTYVATTSGGGGGSLMQQPLMQQQQPLMQQQQPLVQQQQQQLVQYSSPVLHQQHQQQHMQLVRLVPVRRRQHQQQQQQFFAVHPSSASAASSRNSLGRGLYLVSK